MTRLCKEILRLAALLVPRDCRAEWCLEWRSELWYLLSSGGRAPVAFCLGAFRDALWLRRNCARDPQTRLALRSPVQCLAFLGALAAAGAFVAFHHPAVRDSVLPAPYPESRNLVKISRTARSTVAFADYQSLARDKGAMFRQLAFYRYTREKVNSSILKVAIGECSLPGILGLHPVPSPSVLLSRRAWRNYFGGDPRIEQRTIEIAGFRARVAGLIPNELAAVPDFVDAWLSIPESASGTPAPGTEGIVIARLAEPPPNSRWTFHAPGPEGTLMFDCASLFGPPALLVYLAFLGVALLILPATTSLRLGDFPSIGSWRASRRWLFLLAKFALVLPVVIFGTIDLAALSLFAIQPHGLIVGYVVALRWILIDQRARCPVCLRKLTRPTRIGDASQSFLDWYGTEFICDKGHGLMHVPEIPTSCYDTQQWLNLDPSWASLFSPAAR